MIKNKSQFLYTNIVCYVSHLHKFICRFSHFQHIQIASIPQIFNNLFLLVDGIF